VSIQRRLTLGFLAILSLFALNQGIQSWSARLRAQTMSTLDRALKRQILMASVRQQVGSLHSLMVQMAQVEDAQPVGAGAFDGDMARAGRDIHELAVLTDEAERPPVTELETTYGSLSAAWRAFFDNLGVNEAECVAAQLRAEPLGRRVTREILPEMQEQQGVVVSAARERFEDVTRLTNRVSLGIFAASMLLAAIIALLIGRYLTSALSELSSGASLIGAMNLDHRIAVRSSDEIGTVAGAFNDMAANLARARQELTSANAELTVRNTEIEQEKQVSQSLLLNILPGQVAEELAVTGKFAPRYFEDVTILFTDFVGFTLATEKLAAEELVDVLHGYFTAFDRIVGRYQLEKMKTIGDAYFCAGGLPVRTPSHPVDALLAAIELVHEVEEHALPGGDRWKIRVGLHTGPVVAGVVGIRKFAFDVWGDTVNLASRMESGGAPNRINVSETVYRRAKDFFTFESRGRMLTKEKKELDMFLLSAIQPSLMTGVLPGDAIAPMAFAQRYRTYFGKDLTVFPPFLMQAGAQAG
jgi:class 3 adenylate cyclase